VDGLDDVQRFNLDRAAMFAGFESLDNDGQVAVGVRVR